MKYDLDYGEVNDELLYHQLSFLNGILERRNLRFDPEKKNFTRGQGRILMILKRKDGISTKDLSEILDISVGSLNETLNKLEQKEYIKKIPSPDDKRVLLIYLTEKGEKFHHKKPKDMDIFECLSKEEKLEFHNYLNRLTIELHLKLKEEDPERYERMLKHRQKVLKKHFNCDKFNEEWFKIIKEK